jgi:SAM-dependent methyltransferase
MAQSIAVGEINLKHRYRTMQTYSILRRQEDDYLSKIELNGRTLDLGGHQGSSYFSKLKTTRTVEIANFDEYNPETHKSPSGAEHVFDFEKPFPLGDATFDAVLCVNVLEHIYDYKHVLAESHRILKGGGSIYITVPFLFNIHGSPDDYFRYTRSALKRMLQDTEYTSISIEELGYGPCSAVFQNFGGSLPSSALRIACMHGAVLIDKSFSKLSIRYATIRKRVPLGYFVSAQKPL